MVFNSSIFLFGFLPVVFAAFWLARTKRQRYVVLALSGYVFYGYWDWRFCFLLLFSSLVSFTAAPGIERAPGAVERKPRCPGRLLCWATILSVKFLALSMP